MSSGAQKDYGELVLDLVVLAGIWLLLLAYFPPELLFSKTTTTGGDTGSHFYTAWYLKEHLLPQGRILGWVPGNLAGYPLFQLYFPLPFLAMALLGWLIPLQVAFKLVTAAGAFLLPLCAWQGLRLSGRRFPIPILGAVFTLPFLFNETQSMWGGNLPSLLAGEFCYSLGLALLVYFLGSWHRGIHQGKRVVLNGLLLALIGLCHGCTLLFGILAGGLWLLHRDLPQRLVYLLKVYGLAFLLMGFWIVPLLAFSPYNTLHNMTWHIDSWRKVIPPIMMPLMAMVLAHLAYLLLGKQKGAAAWGGAAFFPAVIALAMVLYLVAFHLNVIDIRFIPFAWLALCLWAAIGAGSLCRRLRARLLTPILALVLTALWLGTQVTYIPQWIKWNYQGFEHSPGWEDFAGLSRNLRGGPADPRVLHEHADVHQRLGTTRAFENLPLFAGRNTMEGLYIQSGLNSPFVFYLQSLTSQTPTTPLPEYVYSRFDLKRALPRMILYNVGEFIAVSHKTRQAALKQPGLSLSSEIGPYSIFQVDDNPGTYAVPLKYKPVLVLTRRWKELAFAWFRRGDLEVPLVFKTALAPGDQARYAAIWKDRLGRAPRVRLADTDQFQEKVGYQSLAIHNPSQAPFLVKISYHPNWRVQGAARINLASPAFMLIFPEEPKVELRFTSTWPNHLGLALTIAGLLILLLNLPLVRNLSLVKHVSQKAAALEQRIGRHLEQWLRRPLTWLETRSLVIGVISLLVLAGLLGLYLGLGGKEDASMAYGRAHRAYAAQDYSRAAILFAQALEKRPLSPVADHTAMHLGFSLYKQKLYAKALKAFRDVLDRFPESRLVPEARYHMGLCLRGLKRPQEAVKEFEELISAFPQTAWADYAGQKLREIKKTESNLPQ